MTDCSAIVRAWGELTTDELYAFLKLRTDVFYVEQHIDESELDGRDSEAETEHYWISDEHGVAAYLRTLVDPQPTHLDASRVIGRVVTRADRRGKGLANALMNEVFARHSAEAMLLHAQEYIAPLYAKLGFEPFGAVYPEAGIPHISMYRGAA
jgi:ElaA protein